MFATARLFPVLLAAAGVLVQATAASGQTPSTKPYTSLFLVAHTDGPSRDPVAAEGTLSRATRQIEVPAPAETARPGTRTQHRGAMTAMYGSLVTLQALDAHSTFRALDAGLEEANPLMRWASAHPVAFVSLKATATAGTMFVAEKIRKKHPKRALAFMIAINATYAIVVAHNYRAHSQTR
jgi:hypothetical protein